LDTIGLTCTWLSDGGSLLCAFVDTGRGAAPQMSEVPSEGLTGCDVFGSSLKCAP